MSNLFFSLLLNTVATVLIGGTIIYRAKNTGFSWRRAEYALTYLPWLLMQVIPIAFFDSLDQALNESAFVRDWFILFSIVAGVFGGLSLGTRLVFRKARLPGFAITLLGAGFLAIFNMKLDILVAMFVVPHGSTG